MALCEGRPTPLLGVVWLILPLLLIGCRGTTPTPPAQPTPTITVSDNFPVTTHISQESVVIEAGPVVDISGEIIPDKTTVVYEMTDSLGLRGREESQSQAGFARLVLRRELLPAADYEVIVRVAGGEGSAHFTLGD